MGLCGNRIVVVKVFMGLVWQSDSSGGDLHGFGVAIV